MKRYTRVLAIAVLLIIIFAACGEDGQPELYGADFNKKEPKEQVSIVHLENLKVFLKGDSEKIANAFSLEYKDMFRSKDGVKADVSRTYFEEWFKTENYKACKKLELEELVNVEEKKVYSFDEIMKMNPEAVGAKNVVGFKYEEGDILIKFPKKQDSPMINGWTGVYRKENGVWKIIAGNF